MNGAMGGIQTALRSASARPSLHRAQRRQCASSMRKASRRAMAKGPTPLPGSSARNSRTTSPTPCLPHFFGPITFGKIAAAASNTARETFGPCSNATSASLPARMRRNYEGTSIMTPRTAPLHQRLPNMVNEVLNRGKRVEMTQHRKKIVVPFAILPRQCLNRALHFCLRARARWMNTGTVRPRCRPPGARNVEPTDESPRCVAKAKPKSRARARGGRTL